VSEIFNSSLCFNFIKTFTSMLILLYKDSYLSKFLSKFLIYFKNSLLCGFITSVVEREPTFKYSLFYRTISKPAKSVDNIVSHCNKNVLMYLETSLVYKNFVCLKKYIINNKSLSSFFFVPFLVVYLLAMITFGGITKNHLVFLVVSFAIFIAVYFKDFFITTFKNSFLGICLLKIFK